MDHSDHSTPGKTSISVILVDDDLIVQSIATRLLSQHSDIRLQGCYQGAYSALSAMRDEPPDVIVVDISMPGMGGLELTQQVHRERPEIKILAYTSLADQNVVSKMLAAGAVGVVYKEASIDTLADAIRATSSGLSVLSPRFNREIIHPRTDIELSETETKLLGLLSQGMTNEQIAPLLCLHASTVKYHLSRLSVKLGARNRVALAVAAVHLGLAERPSEP